jgi:hypothetical protein
MKQKIQLGIEGFKNGERVIRLTPFDVPVEVQPQVAMVALGVESVLDARDAQPGDGEVDIEIPVAKAIQMFPWAKNQLEGKVDKVHLFVNLK